MDIKRCNSCGEDVSIDKMVKASRNKDGYASECRACQSAKAAAKFASDEEERARKVRNRTASAARGRTFLWAYLLIHPCVDCGTSDPRVLHFDHLDATLKTRNVSEMVGWGIAAIQREIDKCVVRCANCHMIRTQEQFGHWRGSQ